MKERQFPGGSGGGVWVGGAPVAGFYLFIFFKTEKVKKKD
jgi:hypothetical protein